MRYFILVAVVMLAACSTHGNSDVDYRRDSFSGVNHCLHTTALPCR